MGQKYSVIIPVYNGEAFISRAVESVLSQTVAAHEIIVINDGSKDRTEEILKGFGNKIRFKTIANGGVSNARNQGLAMATGDWVAFLDADDIWNKEKLARHEQFVSRYPQVGFSCCNYLIYDPFLGREVEHFKVLEGYPVAFNEPLRGEDMLRLLVALNFVGTASTVLMRKDVFDRTGHFNTSYRQAEDFELWMRAAMVTDFVILSEVLVEKKTHETNLTNNQFQMHACHETVLIDFLKKNAGYIDARHLRPAFLDAIALTNFKMAGIAYELGRGSESFRLYVKSFSVHPTAGNYLRAVLGIMKKTVRFLSFGLITRKRFQKSRA